MVVSPLLAALLATCARGETEGIGGGAKLADDKRSRFDADFMKKALDAVPETAAGAAPGDARLIDDGGKWKNLFKVGEEVLLLPEVMSKLKIEQRDHAPAGDTRAEEAVRAAAHWGRLYVEGWPQPIQYLRAHFGESPPPVQRAAIFLADPWDACTVLLNADEIQKHSPVIVLAGRGNCTYGTKANKTVLSTAGGGAVPSLVIVNNEPGAVHAPGPDAHDARVFVTMIPEADGVLLSRALARRPAPARGTFVAMNCAEHSETRKHLGQLCDVATAADAELVAAQVDGGALHAIGADGTDSGPFEYLLGLFGVDPGAVEGPVSAAQGDAAIFGCQPLQGVEGAVVVLSRGGGCQFLDKALQAQAVGAAAVVITNEDDADALVRPSAHPRWRGLEVTIPVVLASAAAGRALAAARSVRLEPRGAGHAAAWTDALEPLARADGWPRSADAQLARFDIVSVQIDATAWPDRADWLRGAFDRASTSTAKRDRKRAPAEL
ncbi:hypothetical protein M885DRAFT_542912 [Pelagophyceae sp. CCMP2097]|nr:hypothetical protein M885DRAFT_542912 [Pelagophyceae sp. CCMP2097]